MPLTSPLRALALFLTLSTIAVTVSAAPAFADTAPASASTPATVSSDALPTVQVDGVVWTQIVVGNTVYAGGSFANAYPAGAKAGTNLTPRSNLLAYNLLTGALITTFAPSLNAQVRALAASPDGRTIYAGGSFTQVDGVKEYRTVALNATTGAVVTAFHATADTTVYALDATATTLYIGGAFSSMNGVQQRAAVAVDPTTGALRSAWAPSIPSGNVRAIVVSADGSKIVLGGDFASVDASSFPTEGLAMTDTSSGTTAQPFAVGQTVQDYGVNASILSLWTDGTSIDGSGYVYGSPGDFEGTFSASWNGGAVNWLEDCHGDTYGVAGLGGAVYTVSHAHFCSDVPGGFPQTNPNPTNAIHQHALAFSAAATGTLGTDPYGSYQNFAGQPAPTLLAWYPTLTTGTITGQVQAAWSVATSSNGYVVLGGEFPSVNGVAQAGLVRFAVSSIAPNRSGPQQSGSKWVPTVTPTAAGTLHIGTIANWDEDNATLKYALYRDGATTPIDTVTAVSNGFWNRPALSFNDSGLAAGSTHRYLWTATDPFGNTVSSQSVSAVVGSTALGAYAADVLADGATDYWRFGESSGTTVKDWSGGAPLTAGTGVTFGAPGAIAGDSNTSATFDGASDGYATTSQMIHGPQTFSVEAWFKTTSTSGGRIVGFGDQSTGTSDDYDRHIYMDSSGDVHFGVYPGYYGTIDSTQADNDGQWHQVVGTLGSNGLSMYIDGVLVGTNSAVTSAQDYWGYWRVGGDSTWSGSDWFTGSIDDASVYPTALSAAQVAAQYSAAKNG